VKHFASPSFWSCYEALPSAERVLADNNFELLKAAPKHPALRFKHVGRYWSARVGLHYRALAVVMPKMAWLGSGLATMPTSTNCLDKPNS
jgi:hypothetical protein